MTKLSGLTAAALVAAMAQPTVPSVYDFPDPFSPPPGVPRTPWKKTKQKVADPVKKVARKRQKQARNQNKRK